MCFRVSWVVVGCRFAETRVVVSAQMGGSGRAKRAMPTSQNRDMGHPDLCRCLRPIADMVIRSLGISGAGGGELLPAEGEVGDQDGEEGGDDDGEGSVGVVEFYVPGQEIEHAKTDEGEG